MTTLQTLIAEIEKADKERIKKESHLVEYIIGSKIKAAIYQALLESKTDIDFCSLDELAYAVSSDAVRFLVSENLIEVKSLK